MPATIGHTIPAAKNVELGYSQINTAVACGPSTVVDLGLSVTFTVDGTRPVALITDCPYVYHSIAGATTFIDLVRNDTSATVAEAAFASSTANQVGTVHFERRLMLAAGTYTFKVRLRNTNATGGGTANVFATDDIGTGNASRAIVPSLRVNLV